MDPAQISPEVALIHDDILWEPTMMAVKGLLNLRTHLPTLASLGQMPLSQDAREIWFKCKDLQSGIERPPSCTELEGYALYLYTRLLESYSKGIVLGLSYDTRFKLSLIVWHFHTPPCQPSNEFLLFLESPINKTVWKWLHARYQDHIRRQVPYNEFRQSFDFLLSFQLLPLQQTPKNLDSQTESKTCRHQPRPLRTLVNRRIRSDPILRPNNSIMPVNPSSSSFRRLQPLEAYKSGHNIYGQSYPVHIGQSLGTSVSGHEGQHAESLPPLQSTSLLPESQMCIGSPRKNAGIRRDWNPAQAPPRLQALGIPSSYKNEDSQHPGGPRPREAR